MRKNYTAEEKQEVIDKYHSGVAIFIPSESYGKASKNTFITTIAKDRIPYCVIEHRTNHPIKAK